MADRPELKARGDTGGGLALHASGARTALAATMWHTVAFRMEGSVLAPVARLLTGRISCSRGAPAPSAGGYPQVVNANSGELVILQ